ncbi:MAG: hypothetical protein ABI779_05500, partial [Acidobacteriota bacterium]
MLFWSIAALLITVGASAQQQFPALEKGFRADKFYQFGGLDSVNVFSGALMVNLPIGPDYALDGGLSYGLRLSFNSKIWSFSPFNDGTIVASPDPRSSAGLGWILGMGRLIPDLHPTNTQQVDVYESPDGGDHPFRPVLPPGAGCPTPCLIFPKYTDDGTNLRLRNPAPDVREIDFPDGEIKKFVKNASGAWELREIRSVKSSDVVLIAYVTGSTAACPDGTNSYWTINDTKARSHLVCFTNLLVDSISRPMVNQVVLSRQAQGRQLVYQFGYQPVTLAKPNEDTNTTPNWRQTHDVQVLDTLTQPDQSAYKFDLITDGLIAMTLPTKGKITYQYEFWNVPSRDMCDSTYVPGVGLGGFARGVAQRTFTPAVPAGQTPVSHTWQYARALRTGTGAPWYMSVRLCDVQLTPNEEPIPMQIQLYDELVVTITDPLGHKVASHFSVWPGDDTGRIPNPETSPSGFKSLHYGFPHGRYDPGQNRYLSQETFDCTGACTLKRTSWVRHDPTQVSHDLTPDPFAFKLGSQSTVFHDDPNECVPEGLQATCGISFSDSSGWDKYGHYRQVVSNVRFDNRTDLRAVTTAWNQVAGVPRTFAATDPWVLNTYESSTTTEGGVSSLEQACFDLNTGFLESTRKLAGLTPASNDLAVLYESVNGNVSAEKYYGGDTTPLPSNASTLCTALNAIAVTTPAYRINHEWQNAQLARSQHAGMTFFSRDLTIDLDGLVTSSRDTSGLQTDYAYDGSWRLSSATPFGQAQTTYTYSNATGTATTLLHAKVLEETKFAGTTLGEHEYQYDSFGRLWRQKRRLPGNQWSVRETLYDKLDRTASVSEPASLEGVTNELSFTPPHKTSFVYDIFGRPTLATAPDGKSTTTSYQGSRITARTRSVATSASSETNATVTEHYDAQGRLIKVIESGGSTSAQSPQGAPVETAYRYDVGGRLTEVKIGSGTTQLPRTFQYDLRGFLTSENHPESGITSYAFYDARGHARTRTMGGRTLTFKFDEAERLRKVEEGTRTLKELVFADSNTGADDHQKGKLVTAIRSNDLAYAGTVEVTESYEYKNPDGKNPGGQLSKRTTLVEQVAGSGVRSVIQGFEHTIEEYDKLGLPKTVSMPACLVGSCAAGQGLTSIGYARDAGLLTSVGTFGTLAYHPSGMVKSVSHPTSAPAAIDSYDIQHGMSRPSSIRLPGTSSCPTPSASTITAADTICPGATGTASVQASAGITHQWSISGGTIT